MMSEPQNNNRTIEEMIATALALDPESDEYWKIISDLWKQEGAVFTAARKLCESGRPEEIVLGINIIAQLKISDESLAQEARDIVLRILNNAVNDDVLIAAASAEDHTRGLNDLRAIEPLLRLKNHPNPDVRFEVVMGLLKQKDERAIAALTELSADEDSDVRDWATFGLGSQIDADTPEIREALLRRVNDEDNDVRGEALFGLARRNDKRAIEPLIAQLSHNAEPEEYWWQLLLEAAGKIGDPKLYPALMAIKESGIEDEELDAAIALCRIPSFGKGNDQPDGNSTIELGEKA